MRLLIGLGTVFSRSVPGGSEKPIAFASSTLSLTEQRFLEINKDALAIVWAVKTFIFTLNGMQLSLLFTNLSWQFLLSKEVFYFCFMA